MHLRRTLRCATSRCETLPEKYAHVGNFLYLGRQYQYPGGPGGSALKLKEISYIHAEGYPAAEMKHGPIALVDPATPSVFLMPQGPIYDKVMSNLMEVKARRGPVIAVTTEGDEEAALVADDVIEVPEVAEHLQPLVTAVPLAAAGLPHRPVARLRRGQAAQPRQERDRGVSVQLTSRAEHAQQAQNPEQRRVRVISRP